MVVGRLLSYWDGTFSGAMLNFRGVASFVSLPQMVVFSSPFSHRNGMELWPRRFSIPTMPLGWTSEDPKIRKSNEQKKRHEKMGCLGCI